MIYHTRVSGQTDSIFRSEDFGLAKAAADNHKATTGENCEVESRSVVYVTSTLEEAMTAAGMGLHPEAEPADRGVSSRERAILRQPVGRTHVGALAAPVRTLADRTAEHAAVGFTPGQGGPVADRFRH